MPHPAREKFLSLLAEIDAEMRDLNDLKAAIYDQARAAGIDIHLLKRDLKQVHHDLRRARGMKIEQLLGQVLIADRSSETE